MALKKNLHGPFVVVGAYQPNPDFLVVEMDHVLVYYQDSVLELVEYPLGSMFDIDLYPCSYPYLDFDKQDSNQDCSSLVGS